MAVEGLSSICSSSCASLRAAERTSRADLRPILGGTINKRTAIGAINRSRSEEHPNKKCTQMVVRNQNWLPVWLNTMAYLKDVQVTYHDLGDLKDVQVSLAI